GVPEDADVALGGQGLCGEHPHGGGFAGSVGSQEAENDALGNLEVEAVDCGERTESFDHAAQVEGGHLRGGGGHAPRSGRTPGHTQARVWSDHGTTLGLPLDSFHRFSCAVGSEKYPGVGVAVWPHPPPGGTRGCCFFADRFLPVSFCRSALVGLVGEFVGGVVLLAACHVGGKTATRGEDRKSTRLNSSHVSISYAVFCLKKK